MQNRTMIMIMLLIIFMGTAFDFKASAIESTGIFIGFFIVVGFIIFLLHKHQKNDFSAS